MPSTSRLRQRFDEDAASLMPLINDSLAEVVVNLDAPLTALPSRLDKHQRIALDIDVFPMDNSGTKKEGVAYTYKGHDGYAPIAAYLGQEGWCLGCDLRIGSQHSQKEFIPFLEQVIQRARRITRKALLLRLDSGHDAEESSPGTPSERGRTTRRCRSCMTPTMARSVWLSGSSAELVML